MTEPPAADDTGRRYDDDLRILLAAHGADHRPDRARIRARLDAGLATARQQDPPGRIARHRSRPSTRVAGLAAASLVAAALLFVVVDTGRPVQVSTTGPAAGGSGPARPDGADDAARSTDRSEPTGASLPPEPDRSADPTAVGDPTAADTDGPGIRVPADDPEPSTPAAVPGTDGAPDPLGGGSTPPASTTTAVSGETRPAAPDVPGGAPSSTTAVPMTRPSSTVTSPPTTARPAATTSTVPGPAVQSGLLPQQVVLGPVGHLDWVIVGSRNDGKIVRMKAGTGRLTVSAPSGALPSPSLIPFLWSGGSPEQDRADNSTWWTANGAPSSFVVQVAGADNASEVVLYAGSSSSLVVTVTVSGRGTTQKVVPAGFLGSAAKVTVSLTGADRGRDVSITLGAAKGSVSLGAVTER